LGKIKSISSTTLEFSSTENPQGKLKRLSEFYVLPKHKFAGKPFTQSFHSAFLGSGPYEIESVQIGERVTLKKNPKYWARSRYPQKYQFDRIVFRTVSDPFLQLELLKKGELDYLNVLSSKMWATESDRPEVKQAGVKRLVADTESQSDWTTSPRYFSECSLASTLIPMHLGQSTRFLTSSNLACSWPSTYTLRPPQSSHVTTVYAPGTNAIIAYSFLNASTSARVASGLGHVIVLTSPPPALVGS
jgi:ABC-type transport system substrate-binding protein